MTAPMVTGCMRMYHCRPVHPSIGKHVSGGSKSILIKKKCFDAKNVLMIKKVLSEKYLIKDLVSFVLLKHKK